MARLGRCWSKQHHHLCHRNANGGIRISTLLPMTPLNSYSSVSSFSLDLTTMADSGTFKEPPTPLSVMVRMAE
jgi:hypothetical protein